MYVYRKRNNRPDVVIYRSQETIEAEIVCDSLEAEGIHYHRVAEPDEFL